MIDKILYTEKYRPNNIEDLVLPQRIKDKFKDGLVQNLLLSGSTGTGKTSLAKAICKQFKYPTKYINASLETSVDVIRTKIEDFCTTRSVISTDYSIKVVILDECLEENEKVRIGTVDDWKSVSLKDLIIGEVYPCISMNIETGELENDTCEIISDKEDALYEVELENGKKVKVTSNHPFMILTEKGEIIQKTIDDRLSLTDKIINF